MNFLFRSQCALGDFIPHVYYCYHENPDYRDIHEDITEDRAAFVLSHFVRERFLKREDPHDLVIL